MTVAELRLALDTMEQDWSERDRELLGEFKNQGIYVDVITQDCEYGGLGTPESAYYDYEFGVMLLGRWATSSSAERKETTDG